MTTEFRKAGRDEIRSLMIFDRKAFHEYKSDWFDREQWESCEAWWLMVDGRKVGCCAFEARQRTLYIVTTGILPSHRGCGLGTLMKSWQVAYARQRGFTRIVTNSRKSNRAMIQLNKMFGFGIVRTVSDYYQDPRESTVVMELVLSPRRTL